MKQELWFAYQNGVRSIFSVSEIHTEYLVLGWNFDVVFSPFGSIK